MPNWQPGPDHNWKTPSADFDFTGAVMTGYFNKGMEGKQIVDYAQLYFFSYRDKSDRRERRAFGNQTLGVVLNRLTENRGPDVGSAQVFGDS